MNGERWKAINGFEGRYEVSNCGQVRSVARAVSSPRHGDGSTRVIISRVLSTQVRSGYRVVSLENSDGKRFGKQVHRLVAEAFIDNPLHLPEVNHLDADRLNAHVENLEWCDRARNVAHSYEIGRRPIGQAHHFAKLPRDRGGRCLPQNVSGGWEREEFS